MNYQNANCATALPKEQTDTYTVSECLNQLDASLNQYNDYLKLLEGQLCSFAGVSYLRTEKKPADVISQPGQLGVLQSISQRLRDLNAWMDNLTYQFQIKL